MIEGMKDIENAIPSSVTTLTLEKDSVLVIKVPKNEYDFDAIESLYKACANRFPRHGVLLVYNDVEFTIINDKDARTAERITCNDENPYGY